MRIPTALILSIAIVSACRGTTGAAVDQPVSTVATHPPAAATAQIFAPGVISDAREQWRITFTPDGLTAYFASSDEFFPISRRATIYMSHFREGAWSTPAVAPFSGTYSDIDPFISPDGQRLYFSSIRPVGSKARADLDLWVVEKTPSGWSEPMHLGAEVNSPGDELYVSSSTDGTLFFASGPMAPRAGQHFDIYKAERSANGFRARQGLGTGVNTQPTSADAGPQDAWEFNPEISADGKTLLFTSLRPGGYGLGDLYVSRLVNGEWTAARNLGPLVNTAADEFHPTLSRDTKDLYFIRRGPEQGDFYRISTRLLELF